MLLVATTPADGRGNGHDGVGCGDNHRVYPKVVGIEKDYGE